VDLVRRRRRRFPIDDDFGVESLFDPPPSIKTAVDRSGHGGFTAATDRHLAVQQLEPAENFQYVAKFLLVDVRQYRNGVPPVEGLIKPQDVCWQIRFVLHSAASWPSTPAISRPSSPSLA